MNLKLLSSKPGSVQDLKEIFETFIPHDLKLSIYEYAQWLDGDPEIEHLEGFEDIERMVPSWPYAMKAYAIKYKDFCFNLCNQLKLEDESIAWTNLIKAIAFGGNEYLDELYA